MWSLGHFLSLTYLLQLCTANFTFTYNEATQCDDFQVSWTGGTPPFYVTVIPAYHVQSTITVTDSSFSNNHGVFTTAMSYPAGHKIVVVMSDATGFGSGGASPVISVGDSVHNEPCDISMSTPHNDFDFTNNDALTQCDPYNITEYNYGKAIQPVKLTGVVPGGSIFVLNPPIGSTIFTWITNIAAGTDLILFMTDANDNQGGSTDIMRVAQSQNNACLVNGSPASATNAPSMTTTTAGKPTRTVTMAGLPTITASDISASSRSKPNIPIVAIVVPVVAVIGLIVGILVWRRCHRRNSGVSVDGRKFHPEVDFLKGSSPPSTVSLLRGQSPSGDGTITPGSHSPRHLPTSATTTQFHDIMSVHTDPHGYQHRVMSAHDVNHGSSPRYSGVSGQAVVYAAGVRPDRDSAARRKAAQATVLVPPGHQPPPQFILHTDIEDSVPPLVNEVIELPPQYSERRVPTPSSGVQQKTDDPSLLQPLKS